MLRIRIFEQKILELFTQNKVSGTTHTYIGQESIAVALMNNLETDDIVFSNHRCHGHFLAYGGSMRLLLSEIMAKETGMCKGIGGSQHIHYRNFFTNGVQGGIVPNAAGMAWAEKLKNSNRIATVFIGDGTLGQGTVYETFNMAALYKLPILFVIENNQYAMSTKVENAVSGSILMRPQAFGITANEVKSNDVMKLNDHFRYAVDFVRDNKEPYCQIVHTYRLAAHSKGDDTREPDEIKEKWQYDPLKYLESKLDKKQMDAIRIEVEEEIKDALNYAQEAKMISIDAKKTLSFDMSENFGSILNDSDFRCVESLNHALKKIMKINNDLIIMGEDIEDPYGGTFKVTKGLSKCFPDRVYNTPISEASIIGLAIGLSMNGKRPIVEMMFGDFITLGFDQILNHASKYSWMYGENINVPLIIRAPMGAGRGYGPTHSQSLEKYLTGIPEICIVALSPIQDSGKVLERIVKYTNCPVVLIENKKLYNEKLLKNENGMVNNFYVEETNALFPTIKLSLDKDTRADASVIVYGGMVKEAMLAAHNLLIKDEIQLDIIVPTQLSPYPIDDIEQLTKGCHVIGTMEEGTRCMGWGAEIIASLSERSESVRKYFRVASADLPIPCNVELEKYVIPDASKLEHIIRRIING